MAETVSEAEVEALRKNLHLAVETMQDLFAVESIAELELAFEDKGWKRIGHSDDQFSEKGRQSARDVARTMAIANPLIKNGIAIRTGYIWGKGVQIQVEDDPDSGQDINEIVQTFLDDPDVRASFSGTQAREELERALGTDGERFWSLPTDSKTGQVKIRILKPDEIVGILTDPEDPSRPWFYRREYDHHEVDFGGNKKQAVPRTVFHPALGYAPPSRQRTIYDAEAAAAGASILWDQPVRHMAVNRVGLRGVGDAYAALPWARGNKEFLEAWLTLTKALSQFAFRATSTSSKKVQALAQRVTSAAQQAGGPDVGGTFVGTPGNTIEAIPKTGANIDADSGRPISVMVAAAFQIPVTTLLGDPGATGARAVAETLAEPTQNAMNLRRDIHADAIRDIVNYVIDSAVKAKRLRGTVTIIGDREVVDLPEDDSRLVTVGWPNYSDIPVDVLVKAITTADQTMKVPPLVTLRLLLAALDVDDPEEIIEQVTDDAGNWIPPDLADEQTRLRAEDRGES